MNYVTFIALFALTGCSVQPLGIEPVTKDKCVYAQVGSGSVQAGPVTITGKDVIYQSNPKETVDCKKVNTLPIVEVSP